MNRAGQIVYVGVTAAQAFGVTPEAMLGITFADLGIAPDLDAHMAILREQVLTTQQPASGEVTLPTVAGLRPFEYRLSPVRDWDGHPQAVLYIGRDVADRKREESALRESEERFRASFEQAAVGIAHVGIEGEWLRVNQKLCDILGYSRDELLTLTYHDVRYSDDLDDGRAKLRPLLAGDISAYTVERRYVRKDRAVIWANLTISLVRDAANNPLYYVCFIEDITLLKSAREEIARLNERLHRAVYEASHRIKNQLQILSATADMAILDGQELVPASELRRLRAQIGAIAATHDILTWETRADGTVAYISLKALLARTLAALQQTTDRHLVRFTLDDALVPVKTATSLALIINEAVSNGFKHGSGVVEVTLVVVEGQARLDICDDGPGFPNGFDAPSAANTGLELVMTLTRTDLHGTVEFTNRDVGGARVSMMFPLQALLQDNADR